MSFLSTLKKTSFVALFLFLASCQNLKTREDLHKGSQRPKANTSPISTSNLPPSEGFAGLGHPPIPDGDGDDQEITTAPAPLPPPPPIIPSMPKIAFVLGPGGAKTYAHIGFLHELVRAKVPVQAIAGVEFAAPMAALYASREQANDVEWQMFKLKDEEILKKSLLGSVHKNNEVTVLKEFFGNAFNRTKIEDFRVSFACPSYSLKKNQVYMMNKGGLDQIMYTCVAYPPFFKPFQNSIAAVRDISALAAYLRTKGANYVVLVNVLQPPGGANYTLEASATDNVLWSEIAGSYNKPFSGVDAVISLDTSGYGIMDFDKRRDIMSKGADSAAKQLKVLTRKWGL